MHSANWAHPNGASQQGQTSFVGIPVDVTSDVIKAMMDKLEHHGGTMDITENGKPVATITLTKQGGQDE